VAGTLIVTNNGDGNVSGLGDVSNLIGQLPLGTGVFALNGLADINTPDSSSQTYSYGFTPFVRGTHVDTFQASFLNGSPDGTNQPNSQEFSFVGEAVAPQHATSHVDAPLTRVGTSVAAAARIEIQNEGDGNLSGLGTISNLQGAIDSGSHPSFIGGGASFSLLDSESIQLPMEFAPTARGNVSSEFTLSFSNGSDDGTNQSQVVPVSIVGQGVGPDFEAWIVDENNLPMPATAFQFGPLGVGEMSERSFEIRNTTSDPNGGNESLTDLTILDWFFTGNDADHFELVGLDTGSFIHSGESLSLLVRFSDASGPGTKMATLVVVTDVGAGFGQQGTSYSFALEAEVLAPPEPPSVSVFDASVIEGNADAGQMFFSLVLSRASSQLVQIAFSTLPGTASAGSDYMTTSGIVTFQPGETQQLVPVTITGDRWFEGTETFLLNLESADGATISRDHAIGTITNDDGPPQLATFPANGSSLDFGYILVNTVGKAEILVINVGDGEPLVGEFPGLTGEFYTISQGFSLAIGESRSRAYRYVPDHRGADEVAINFGEGSSVITLHGVGVAPVSSVMSGSTEYVLVGRSGAATLFVTNTGDGNLSGLGPSSNLRGLAPPIVDGFVLSGPSEISLADGAVLPLHYQFTPTVRGAFESIASLVFHNGHPDENNRRHTASGVLEVHAVAPLQEMSIVNAGLVRVGTQGFLPAQITIVNRGDGNQSGQGAESNLNGTIDEGTIGVPFQGGGLGFSLPDGASQVVPIVFSPTARGMFQSTYTLSFENGSADEMNSAEQILAQINGQGVGPEFAAIPQNTLGAHLEGSQLDFGTVPDGEQRDLVLEIRNSTLDPHGSSQELTDLTLLSIEIVGLDAGSYSLVNFEPGTVLHAGEAWPLVVRFHSSATTPGTKLASLVITTDVGTGLGLAGESFEYALVANSTRVVAPRTIRVADVSAFEGDSGITFLEFFVTLSGSSESEITVRYATADGTALAGSDYQALSGVLRFGSGVVEQIVRVPIVGDRWFAHDEWFALDLTDAEGASVERSRAMGTIVNDDALPRLTVHDASIDEGDSGSQLLVFELALSSGSEEDVHVDFATADQTAEGTSDYTPAMGRISFAPGEATAQIQIQVIGDTRFEADETFLVQLSGAQGAIVERGVATGSIINDDATLSGSVYLDLDYNGRQGPLDQGLAGVRIRLEGRTRAGTMLARETFTSPDGSFRFTDLPQGVYAIVQQQPTGYLDGIESYLGPRQIAVDGNDRFSAILTGGETPGLQFAELFDIRTPQPPVRDDTVRPPQPPATLRPEIHPSQGSPIGAPSARDPLDVLINLAGGAPTERSADLAIGLIAEESVSSDRAVIEAVAVAVEDGRIAQLLFFAPISETDVEPPSSGFRDGVISGRVFEDLDGDKKVSAGDPIRAQVVVYLDRDGDGEFEADEMTMTDLQGQYEFTELGQRGYAMRVMAPEGWESVDPDRTVELSPGERQVEDINFVQKRQLLMASAEMPAADVAPWWYLAVPITAGLVAATWLGRWMQHRFGVARGTRGQSQEMSNLSRRTIHLEANDPSRIDRSHLR